MQKLEESLKQPLKRISKNKSIEKSAEVSKKSRQKLLSSKKNCKLFSFIFLKNPSFKIKKKL